MRYINNFLCEFDLNIAIKCEFFAIRKNVVRKEVSNRSELMFI